MKIIENESLSKHTTFHIGGPAKYFAIVKNADELKEVLLWARENHEKYFILGSGSNVLFTDGFDGLIIKLMIQDIIIEGNQIIAGAGAPLFLAVKKTADAGLKGLESFAGIPGTIGGAICNNAGAYGSAIGGFVEKAEILIVESSSPYQLKQVDNDWFEFAYRSSKLKAWPSSVIPAETGISSGKPILTRIWLKLKKANQKELERRIKQIMEERGKKELKGFCAGCAFKNIKGAQVKDLLEKYDFTPEEKKQFEKYNAIPAAWLIERAGLKGYKIGGAYIPQNHANYIMNNGTATADHILQMVSFIKQQVRDKFGVQLEEEIQIIR